MGLTGVLVVMFDAIDVGARFSVLPLQARDEEGFLALYVHHERDRALRGNKREVRVVQDVRAIEEHDA